MGRFFSRLIFINILGWKLEGFFPSFPKYIVAVVPHTSWIDFFIGILVRSVSGESIKFVGKKELFNPFTGWFFRSLGGTPIDRSGNKGSVESIVAAFEDHEKFRIALAPEGTRKRVKKLRSGFYQIAKKLQKWLLSLNRIKTVVISEALKKIIQDFHHITSENIYVFHDAARSGQLRMSLLQRKELRETFLSNIFNLEDYQKVVGYFGHLYSGRGIEIIEKLAELNSGCAFVVYGGNEAEIEAYKSRNTNKNLFFMGYVHSKKARRYMAMMDVLIMPYQKSVSIGVAGIDTSKWMSPLKLFEYLSVGVPIISSNISVLKEVLVDNENCLLVEPDDIYAWSYALRYIISNTELEERLGSNAYNLYKDTYTWEYRARGMLALLSN